MAGECTSTNPGSCRGAYSTNAFSLVGLGIAGLKGIDDWAGVDQRKLAWGASLPRDDGTLFATRGPCAAYPNVAHQYTSESEDTPYHDIAFSSCLNNWLGGNLAARCATPRREPIRTASRR